MTNCHNYGTSVLVKTTATSTAGDFNIAGFIGRTTGDGATLRMKMYDCTNNAALTTEWADATLSVLRVAGITAYSHSSWNNCHNNKSAKITVKGKITSTAANSYFQDRNSDTQVTIGGIGGYLASTGSYDCNNYADVEVDATWTTTKASYIQIGGITGRTHNKIWRGVNYGNIYLKGDSSGILDGIKATLTIDKKATEVTCNGQVFVGGAAGITYYDCADLHNEGNIYVTGNHNLLVVGGVAGGSSAEAKNFTNKGSVNVDATYNKTLNVGGVVGYAYYDGQSDILDCHNYGKVNILGDAKAGMHIAGVAAEVDGSHNKEVYNHKGADIYVNLTSSASTLHVGGCMYRSKDKLTGAVNEGNITVEGKVGGTLYIGGVVSIQNGYDRTNLINKGKITVGANINGGSCFVGGICYDGQYNKIWKNCHNEGDIEFTKSFSNTGNVRSGGILGKFETAQYGIFDGCSNSGNITFLGHSDSYIRLGGMIGCHKGDAIVVVRNGFTNSGNITYAGDVAGSDYINIGGIIGCPSGTYKFKLSTTTTDESGASVTSEEGWSGTVVNTGTMTLTGSTDGGKLRAGGFFGLLETAENPFHEGAKFYQLGDIVFTGDPGAKNGTPGESWVGGAVAYTLAPVSNVECYCKINAPTAKNVGFISGSVRTPGSVIATNCKIGGSVVGEYDEDEDVFLETSISSSNFYNYLFGSGKNTDWTGTDNYDGCTYLSSKPAIQ